jgi:hypothetical protein
MRQWNYSVADLCGSILTLLSSQVKKMGGAGSSRAALSGSTTLNPAPSLGGYLNVQKQFRVRSFFMVEVFRPNSSILLRENSRHDCLKQAEDRFFRPHRPGR